MLLRDVFRAHQGLSSLLLHGVGLLIRLAFMLAVLRWSGPNLLGIFGLMVAIEVVTVYLCGLEFHTFTTRRYARRPTNTMLRLCAAIHLRLLLVCMPVSAVVSAAAAMALHINLSTAQLVLFGTIVASGMLANEIGRFMLMTDRPLQSVFMTFIRATSWQPLVLPFLGISVELTALLSLWTFGSLVGTGWGLWIMRASIGSAARPRLSYLFRGLALSRTYYLTTSASVLQSNLDRLVLQTVIGPAAVGIFTFFQTLANTLPALVQSAVLNVWLPQLLVKFGQRAPTRMQTLSRVVRRCWQFSAILTVAICAAALPLVWLTSHNDYLVWLWLLPLLLAAQILLVVSQPQHLAIYAAHRDQALMWLSVGSLALALVISIGLVITFGLPGAAASPLIGACILWSGRRWVLQYLAVHGKL